MAKKSGEIKMGTGVSKWLQFGYFVTFTGTKHIYLVLRMKHGSL